MENSRRNLGKEQIDVMSEEISIVLIHQGYDWYLYYTLNQIKSLRMSSPLYLLGDKKVISAFDKVDSINLNLLYSTKAREFVDNYVHMSTNSYDFELFCFSRWFYLLEFMKFEKLPKVLYLDSDVLLYTPPEKIVNIYGEYFKNCGYLIPQQEHDSLSWTASGHTSYWNYETLEEFCHFLTKSYQGGDIFRLYQQKWDHHQSKKILGGVNDMTSLYFFWRQKSKHITNFSEVFQDNTFDHNINAPMNYFKNEYKMRGSLKLINFKKNIPFGETIDRSREIRFHTLHFQGAAKRKMPMFYTGKPFNRKLLHNIDWILLKIREK